MVEQYAKSRTMFARYAFASLVATLLIAAISNYSFAAAPPPSQNILLSLQQNPVPFGYNDTFTATSISMPAGTTLTLYVNGVQQLSGLTYISCDLSGNFGGQTACYYSDGAAAPLPAGTQTMTVNAINSGTVLKSSSMSVDVAPSINQPYCVVTGSYVSLGGCLEAAIPLSAIGLLVTFAMVAIAYMLGEVVRIDGLKKWYKGELWEAAKTIMLLVVIFSALIILSGIALNFVAGAPAPNLQIGTPGGSNRLASNLQSLYSAADDFTVAQLTVAENAYDTALGLADGIQFLKSISLAVWFPIPLPPYPLIPAALQFGFTGSIYNTNVLESFDPLSYSFLKAFIAVILVPIVVILEFQSEFLYTGAIIGIGIFIPIGVVLRGFPFMRGIGGNMIAVGIATAIIYPSVLVLFNLPISSMIGSTLAAPVSQSCSGLLCSVASFGSDISGVFSSDMATGFTAGFDSFGSIYPAMNIITSKMFIDVLLQFVLFIFDLVIVVVITQSIAKTLGGELNISFGKFSIA
ncbi:MAG: hypothetical protein M1164_01645 [Candidatus Marsarchaeota archaeon]|nr:hypothetical protein [Candidatus Marsarchaeota archaeon]